MQDLKQITLARNVLKKSIREFFQSQGFLEIDTPILVKCPGTELHLGYFKTEWIDHKGSAHRLWLRSSPELAMKRALCEGLEAVFQLAPSFRNYGELGPWHLPEFTMLEWYQVGTNFDSFVSQTENLIRTCLKQMRGHFSCPLTLPQYARKWTLAEAFREFADVDLVDQDPDLARQAKAKGILSVSPRDDFETAFFKILLEKIEPALERLGFVMLYDYPPSQAALARVVDGVAKRFEFYVNGIELSNGFWELCDLDENKKRIREVHAQRRLLGKDVPDEDEEFYAALAKGLPDCFGNALGFDRLLALILGRPIRSSKDGSLRENCAAPVLARRWFGGNCAAGSSKKSLRETNCVVFPQTPFLAKSMAAPFLAKSMAAPFLAKSMAAPLN